jgi:hypothetical protein
MTSAVHLRLRTPPKHIGRRRRGSCGETTEKGSREKFSVRGTESKRVTWLKAFLQHTLRLLVVALAAGAAGCGVQQKPRGVFPTEHLPPPPSERGLKGATSRTEAQAGAPARKPLSVPR